MGYMPRMDASIEGIAPIDDVNSLKFDQMVVDFWKVEAKEGASGKYLSPDPRFVMFFDKASIGVREKNTDPLSSCNVCFVPGGMSLSAQIENIGLFEHLDIHLDEAHLQQIAGTEVDLTSLLSLSASSELKRLGALLADECKQPKRPCGYSECLVMGMIHEVFHLGVSQESAKQTPSWFKNAEHYMMSNLHMPMKVEQIAATVGMSRSEFSRKFKEVSGLSPYQWIMRTRIEQAQNLLVEGCPLAHIAHDIGFADQAHFNRCFRQATSFTPGQWVSRYVSTKN